MFPQQMFPVRANGETFRETTMFPQQCFLVYGGLYNPRNEFLAVFSPCRHLLSPVFIQIPVCFFFYISVLYQCLQRQPQRMKSSAKRFGGRDVRLGRSAILKTNAQAQ